MRANPPARSVIPSTVGKPVETSADDEYDGERFFSGLALCLLLSAVLWVGLTVALYAALG